MRFVQKTRAERAAAAAARMPHVPPLVAGRVRAAFEVADFPQRGVFSGLERFFRHMEEEGRAIELARAEDFRAVAASRTSFRALIWGLQQFCPEAPLAAAREVAGEWDCWLNSTYNAKESRPRRSRRVAWLPEDWPVAWQEGLPCLDRVVWIGDVGYKRPAAKRRAAMIQAVGMLAAGRAWAAERGVALGEAMHGDLMEALVRYLLAERETSSGTAADYLERVRGFGLRARLLTAETDQTIGELIGALREEADEAEPAKRKKVRQFKKRFTLADLLLKAVELAEAAEDLPGHTAEAASRRREALVLALLANTADRQGDLSRHRIGIDVVRRPDGLWEPAFAQSKGGREKDLGLLWPVVGRIADAHLLGDRPEWVLPELLAELHGANLLSLEPEGLDLYYPSKVIRLAFGVSAHLVRTLAADAIRIRRPDAAWAAQIILGHHDRRMQETYRTDFRDLQAVRDYQRSLDKVHDLAVATAQTKGRANRKARTG